MFPEVQTDLGHTCASGVGNGSFWALSRYKILRRHMLVRPFQDSRAAPGTLRKLRRKFCDGSS